MTVIVHFEPRNLNATNYAELMRRLDAAGHGAPRGRLYHLAYGPSDQLRVVDIWDSADNLKAFGATLMPLLASLGVTLPTEPAVAPVTNIVRG